MDNWINLPFFRALAEQILMFGVPRKLIMLNLYIGFVFIMGFGFWYILLLNILIHFGAIYIAKDDSQFFDALIIYNKKKNYYST